MADARTFHLVSVEQVFITAGLTETPSKRRSLTCPDRLRLRYDRRRSAQALPFELRNRAFLGMGVALQLTIRRTTSYLPETGTHHFLNKPARARAGDHSRENMRKLRRLPWRIPKSHNSQSTTPALPEAAPHAQPERQIVREVDNTQPVAFAGGRYVYGMASSVPCTTEIRHKGRHRTVTPLGATATR
jgi:hypothetical protein